MCNVALPVSTTIRIRSYQGEGYAYNRSDSINTYAI